MNSTFKMKILLSSVGEKHLNTAFNPSFNNLIIFDLIKKFTKLNTELLSVHDCKYHHESGNLALKQKKKTKSLFLIV